ncbi:MAG: M48 family metalloprotease [Deltaproteobacteria bacterium]|nr:M48 family metalloprotease [Deltaproteobacteria bacterium]
MFRRLVVVVALVCAFVWSPRARAFDLAAFDAAANAELEAKDATAAKAFREANAAREKDPARAATLYGEVLARVPDFDHALRRKCGVDVQLGRVAEGIALCRKAVAIRRSAENLAGLAVAIAHRDEGALTASLRTEALTAIDEAAKLSPNDAYVHAARCQIALALAEWNRLRESVIRLDALAPNEVHTQMFGALLAMYDGRLHDADARIERARALGAAPELLSSLQKTRAKVEAEATPWKRPVLALVQATTAWALGILLLALAGFTVSKLTLRSLEKPGGDDSVGAVRKAYRAIIWIGAAYYYVSLPLVAVFVIGGFGAITLLFLTIGVIPVKLLAILGVLTLATLWATLRSVFVRVPDVPPGTAIGEREHPRFREVLDEVAGKIGTRALDEVRLTVGTDLAVTERGSRLGRGKRTLILGVGLLEGLRVRELKSLLAHEFGHFRNEDTAGGGLAIRVRRTIFMMAMHLAKSGAATWWNPAWWFVLGYHKLFLRITQGASRLQEVLADRWAVLAYGSKAFRRGLRHVIERSVAFDAHVERSVSDATDLRRGWANLYQYRPSKPVEDEDVKDKVAEQLEAAASPYDSHPAPADRLATAKALASEGEPVKDGDQEEAWSLFDDRDALERRMTDEVRDILGAQGVVVGTNDDSDEAESSDDA